jgi:hypothetical protein
MGDVWDGVFEGDKNLTLSRTVEAIDYEGNVQGGVDDSSEQGRKLLRPVTTTTPDLSPHVSRYLISPFTSHINWAPSLGLSCLVPGGCLPAVLSLGSSISIHNEARFDLGPLTTS